MNDQIVISFDLDFTLIDNTEGILNSFKYAFQSYKLKPIDDAILEKTIGEPLQEVFCRFTNIEPNLLIAAFRDYYRKKGIYQVKLYDGVIHVLSTLKENDFILGIVTSKKRELAVKLTKYLNIFPFFDFIQGESETIKYKTDPLLKEFFHTHFPPQNYNYIIVGDHVTDRNLAEMLNCPFIGVLTGHQSNSTLKNGTLSYVEILSHISDLGVKIIKNVIKSSKRKKVKN